MVCSVIICAHNPRADFLGRALDALKAQTLSKDAWELLLIDNASKEPLAGNWNLSWHKNARHIREDELGLTPARLRGIKSAISELLVFVDDDNVLAPDFLANAVQISKDFPFLGAWGGQVDGEFEAPVPSWLEPHLSVLAVRKVDRECWSNYYADNRSIPFGAGFCIRKVVAVAYVKALDARPKSKLLGRKGASLVSGEDIDMALTAFDNGFGTGMFPRLRTTHLIPKARMNVDYLCRLLEGIEYSTHMLRNQRNAAYMPPEERSKIRRWLRAYQVWKLPEPLRSIAKAENRGLMKAKEEISASVSST